MAIVFRYSFDARGVSVSDALQRLYEVFPTRTWRMRVTPSYTRGDILTFSIEANMMSGVQWWSEIALGQIEYNSASSCFDMAIELILPSTRAQWALIAFSGLVLAAVSIGFYVAGLGMAPLIAVGVLLPVVWLVFVRWGISCVAASIGSATRKLISEVNI